MRIRYLLLIPIMYCVVSALLTQWKAETCAWNPVPVERAVAVAESEFKKNMQRAGFSDQQAQSFSCRKSCRVKVLTGFNIWRYIMADLPNEFAILATWGGTKQWPVIDETMYVSSCGRFIEVSGSNEWYS